MVKSALWAAFVAAAPLARPMDAGCRPGFGGVNLVVYDENVEPNRDGEGNAFINSDELPALPSATLQSSYGVESACHYNGTIVLAGSSPFSGSFAEEGHIPPEISIAHVIPSVQEPPPGALVRSCSLRQSRWVGVCERARQNCERRRARGP